MEVVCLPWMGTPYGRGGFSHVQPSDQRAGPGPWEYAGPPPVWGQMQPQETRKRGWEGTDDTGDARAVRRCAEGTAHALSFAMPGPGFHGAPATAAGGAAAAGPAMGGMHAHTFKVQNGSAVGDQYALPAHQQANLLQQQPLNAFQVLMSAAPIKVDGVVCTRYMQVFCPARAWRLYPWPRSTFACWSSCRLPSASQDSDSLRLCPRYSPDPASRECSCLTTQARPTGLCFHCGRLICRPCLKQCARCAEDFCSHCATVKYAPIRPGPPCERNCPAPGTRSSSSDLPSL